MKWIRGGNWDIQHRAAWLAGTKPPKDPRNPSLIAVSWPGSRATTERLGLEYYDLQPRSPERILGHYRAIQRRYAPSYSLTPLAGVVLDGGAGDELFPKSPTECNAELRELLERYGPLIAVRGVPLADEVWRPRPEAVHLPSFFLEVVRLGWMFGFLELTPQKQERRWLAAYVAEGLKSLVEELNVVPTFRRGKVGFEVAPRTLRAYLWRYLFYRCESHTTRSCPYCGSEFLVKSNRGRPPSYCEEHRHPKFRKAVAGGYAPAQTGRDTELIGSRRFPVKRASTKERNTDGR
jgi:hypothetical protein